MHQSKASRKLKYLYVLEKAAVKVEKAVRHIEAWPFQTRLESLRATVSYSVLPHVVQCDIALETPTLSLLFCKHEHVQRYQCCSHGLRQRRWYSMYVAKRFRGEKSAKYPLLG